MLRACLVTQRRIVEMRYSRGPERDAWLTWLEKVEADGRLPISDELWEMRPKPR